MSRYLHPQSVEERDQDIVPDCLEHPIRQSILRLLRNQDVPMHLADLARDLAARNIEKVSTRDDSDARDPTQLYTMLYHCHIPKLADADLVSYDQEQRTVTVAAPSPRRTGQ